MTSHTPAIGTASSDSFQVQIRPARTRDEFVACVDLQRDTWGRGFSDVVPLSMLQITAKMKGVVTGAFGPDGTLYGFVYGVTGLRRGELAHWSHMLAVRPEARNRGIGRRLKLAQKEELLGVGVRTMYWTFDPLVARNAHLNINLLGATVDEFVQNMYGTSDSELHQLGTDRFIAKWDLARTQATGEVDRASTSGEAPRDERAEASRGQSESRPVVWAPGSDTTLPPPDAELIEVLIPRDIEEVEARSFDEALGWRRSTRRAFNHFLDGHYAIRRFIPGETHGRYVVSRLHPKTRGHPA